MEKYISMRRVYQNGKKIAKDWLGKIKYTRLKN